MTGRTWPRDAGLLLVQLELLPFSWGCRSRTSIGPLFQDGGRVTCSIPPRAWPTSSVRLFRAMFLGTLGWTSNRIAPRSWQTSIVAMPAALGSSFATHLSGGSLPPPMPLVPTPVGFPPYGTSGNGGSPPSRGRWIIWAQICGYAVMPVAAPRPSSGPSSPSAERKDP